MNRQAAAGEETRRRLCELVAGRPGLSIQDLAGALGIRRTAVVHHLRLLGRAGRVRSVRSGRRVLVFPPASSPFEGLLGLVRVRAVQRLVALVQAEPGLSVRGLARRLGVTPRAVRYHVLRLRGFGLLELRWGPGGRRVLVLDPKASTLLEEEPPPAEEPPALVLAR